MLAKRDSDFEEMEKLLSDTEISRIAQPIFQYLRATLSVRTKKRECLTRYTNSGGFTNEMPRFVYPWGFTQILLNCPQLSLAEFEHFMRVFSDYVVVRSVEKPYSYTSTKGNSSTHVAKERWISVVEGSAFLKLVQQQKAQIPAQLTIPRYISVREALRWFLFLSFLERSSEDPFSAINVNSILSSMVRRNKIPSGFLCFEEIYKHRKCADLIRQIQPLEDASLIVAFGRCEWISFEQDPICEGIDSGFVDPAVASKLRSEIKTTASEIESLVASSYTAFLKEDPDNIWLQERSIKSLKSQIGDEAIRPISSNSLDKQAIDYLKSEGLISFLPNGKIILALGEKVTKLDRRLLEIEEELKKQPEKWWEKSIEITPSRKEIFPLKTEKLTIQTKIEPFKEKTTAHRRDLTGIFLGDNKTPPQYGLLGWRADNEQEIFLDLNTPKTISIFGRQGEGKSYTVGVIAEMSLLQIPNLNHLAVPLSVIVFHYSKDEGYKPEFYSMKQPNNEESEIQILASKLDVSPQGVKEAVIVVPPHKIEKRRREYSGLEVYPLQFNPADLRMDDWLMLMAAPSQSLYIEEFKRILKKLEVEDNVNVTALCEEVKKTSLSDSQKNLAVTRLRIAEQYMLEDSSLKSLIRPGRLTLLDLRDEMLESDEAMRLCLIALKLFSNVKEEGRNINKLIILDEAHKYMNSAFACEIETVVREMRHTMTSVIVASQDPLSIPDKIIGLSSLTICHRITDNKWIKHIKSGCQNFAALDEAEFSRLKTGEAFIWASKATSEDFISTPIRTQIRPRITKHGGATMTAL